MTRGNRNTDKSSVFTPLFMIIALALSLVFLSAPASAHKGHEKHPPAKAQAVQPSAMNGMEPAPASVEPSNQASVGDMMDDMDMEMDRSKMSFGERLLAWIGHLHPFIVHFPIAFIPAALITAIAGRRRPSFAAPVQFLVVAGGTFAPIAAIAGWLAGMSADP